MRRQLAVVQRKAVAAPHRLGRRVVGQHQLEVMADHRLAHPDERQPRLAGEPAYQVVQLSFGHLNSGRSTCRQPPLPSGTTKTGFTDVDVPTSPIQHRGHPFMYSA
jgi:hypothetical protein